MKNKKTILLFVFLLIFSLPVAVWAKTKWQALLEKNRVPVSYWKKYLPNVTRDEYHKAVNNYLGIENNTNKDDKNDDMVIEGKYPLPASSGKIAKEQHLWLSNGQSAASHYAMTNTPKSCRNGMAGGYGSFGPLSKKDKKDEKYYITMRWGYVKWVEPKSDLALKITKDGVSLKLDNAADFPKSGYVKIGREYLHYSSKSGDKLKGLTRGYKSLKSSHKKNEKVYLVYKYHGGQWERLTRALSIETKKKKWYREAKILVTNKDNGKKVVTSVLDSGPAIWTDRVAGLSPEAFAAINASNNQKCTFQYVDSDTELGPVK